MSYRSIIRSITSWLIEALLIRVHPETPNETLTVSDADFSTSKRGIFRLGRDIERLRGGVKELHALRGIEIVDTARAGKDFFEAGESGRKRNQYSHGRCIVCLS
jgi:hypothetical protein